MVLFFKSCCSSTVEDSFTVVDSGGSPSNFSQHRLSQITIHSTNDKIEIQRRHTQKKPGLITDQNIDLVILETISHHRSDQNNQYKD